MRPYWNFCNVAVNTPFTRDIYIWAQKQCDIFFFSLVGYSENNDCLWPIVLPYENTTDYCKFKSFQVMHTARVFGLLPDLTLTSLQNLFSEGYKTNLKGTKPVLVVVWWWSWLNCYQKLWSSGWPSIFCIWEVMDIYLCL